MVFNAAFRKELGWSAAVYETSQAASPHFSCYARSLARSWVQRFGLEGKTVLEVGCGSGEFLAELLRAGVGKAIGIDPLLTQQQVEGNTDRRLELIRSEFNGGHAELESSALVCRHTLEHIADVKEFLLLVARWAHRRSDRVVLFEVPASERIFAECAFWDIYYEHCNYFTKSSLRRVFTECGLQIDRLEHTYGAEYLVLEARAMNKTAAAPTEPEIIPALRSALDFGSRVERKIGIALRNMRALAGGGRLVVWQGAAKAVGFLTALGVPGLVSYAIDINPRRHGFYLPGLATKVVSPDSISRLRPCHVILMNATYLEEVTASLECERSHPKVLTVNQVCEEM